MNFRIAFQILTQVPRFKNCPSPALPLCSPFSVADARLRRIVSLLFSILFRNKLPPNFPERISFPYDLLIGLDKNTPRASCRLRSVVLGR